MPMDLKIRNNYESINTCTVRYKLGSTSSIYNEALEFSTLLEVTEAVEMNMTYLVYPRCFGL